MILYRDENWLAVDKPEGMATHAATPGELGAVEWLQLHLGLTAHVVSRLDRGTSGVLLLALNPAASARAQIIHQSDEAAKFYEFFSHKDAQALGLLPEWVCDDPLDGKTATTRFSCLGPVGAAEGPDAQKRAAPLFRYRARITHGRKHQIRRHAAAAGIPILGDGEHGGRPHGRLCLHCAEVRWPELDGPVLSELPPSFAAVLRGDTSASHLGLALCRDRRGQWPAQIADCFRAVHRDEIQGLPASVDVFGQWFNAVWYDETADPAKAAGRLDPVLKQLMKIHDLKGGVVRTHRRNPHESSLVGKARVVGEEPPATFTVQEHGLRFEINLLTTQHTGLFLDQRDTRRRLALPAAGKRLANLFAFTCSFSVAAAAAGCEVVFSVDTARACLATGKTNFELNGLAETGRGKFIQEDARKWLERQLRRQQADPEAYPGLDLAVCDPPVFASSRDGGQFAVEKEWPLLAASVHALLAPGGEAVFANNHRGGKHGFYRAELEKHFAEVVDLRPPLDFPVAEGRPHHVRTFWCRKGGAAS